MPHLFSLLFTYEGVEHYCIMRVKESDDTTEFFATVMNGELERRLYGNHVFVIKNGWLMRESEFSQSDQSELRSAIADALKKHLSMAES